MMVVFVTFPPEINLSTVSSGNIYIENTVYWLLTDEDKQIAINKG